ncbi:MAG: redoxin domain-containing protein [Bradymonadaceae bacterium]|nr:redoxin domain-containing protein [Lujinxingiaceae bacterium]
MAYSDVRFRNEPVRLEGNEVKPGELAPNFAVSISPSESVEFDDLRRDRVVILASVPSVTIAACAVQLRVLDAEIPRFEGSDNNIPVWVVTSDSPAVLQDFSQRWDLRHLHLASDYRDGQFGQRFGMKMVPPGILARGLYTIDKDGTIAYREITSEALDEPDYYRAFKAALTIQPRS